MCSDEPAYIELGYFKLLFISNRTKRSQEIPELRYNIVTSHTQNMLQLDNHGRRVKNSKERPHPRKQTQVRVYTAYTAPAQNGKLPNFRAGIVEFRTSAII